MTTSEIEKEQQQITSDIYKILKIYGVNAHFYESCTRRLRPLFEELLQISKVTPKAEVYLYYIKDGVAYQVSSNAEAITKEYDLHLSEVAAWKDYIAKLEDKISDANRELFIVSDKEKKKKALSLRETFQSNLEAANRVGKMALDPLTLERALCYYATNPPFNDSPGRGANEASNNLTEFTHWAVALTLHEGIDALHDAIAHQDDEHTALMSAYFIQSLTKDLKQKLAF